MWDGHQLSSTVSMRSLSCLQSGFRKCKRGPLRNKYVHAQWKMRRSCLVRSMSNQICHFRRRATLPCLKWDLELAVDFSGNY